MNVIFYFKLLTCFLSANIKKVISISKTLLSSLYILSLAERSEQLEKENIESLQKVEQQQQLIKELEHDLVVMQTSSPTAYRSAADVSLMIRSFLLHGI